MASFLWFLHQPASGPWLKRELAVRHSELRFAFSRPGLTTFKSSVDVPIDSPFARAFGRSLGRATVEELGMVIAELPARMRLHVFERDVDRPAEERDPRSGTRATRVEQAIRTALPDRFFETAEAKAGDTVLDVITAPAEEADETLFVGWHRHDGTHGPFPGGVPHVAIPADAPSRAWAKIEEAIRWSGLLPRAGETAVELGSSPGGASFALLQRGLTVHGVDPGAMAPIVLQHPRFVPHAVSAASVERRDLPRTFEWLASDMNLAPMVALKYIERFVALSHGGLRGAFLTLKITDEGIVDALPQLRGRIARLGGRGVRYTQLPSHRSEIVAIVTF